MMVDGIMDEGNGGEMKGVVKEAERKEVNVEQRGDVKVETGVTAEVKHTGFKFWAVFMTVGMGMFFSGYDATCVTTITPLITDEFNSLNDIAWYGIAYSLTSCTMILSYGKLYSFFPMKHIFTSALLIFLIGNTVCATAPSSLSFIIGRALSGFGNAGLLSGCTIIISRTTPLPLLPLYSSIAGGLECIAIILAPLISGFITAGTSWRVCFYIIIPFVVLMLLTTFLFIDVSNTTEQASLSIKEKLKQLDLPGIMIFWPAIVSFTLALQWGGSVYAWGDGRIVGLFVVFGVFTVGFAVQQWYCAETATISPALLKERTVTFGCLFMFAVSGSGFVVEFYSPLYYQAIHSTTPLGSALRDLPRLLALALSILLAGSVTTCIGFYTPTMLLGSILMSVGAGLITTWNTTTSLGQIIGYNLLYGAGVGFAFQQPFIAVQTVLPQKDVPAAIVVLQFAQYLGNIVALAVGESVFVEGLVEGLKGVEGVDEKLVLRVGALDLKRVVPEGVRGVVLGVYADALDRAFLVGCVLACGTVVGALGVKWRSVKGEKKVDGVERRVKKLEV